MAVYSVQDFNVAGDGTTDDTAALQLLLLKAQGTGGTVWFPNGEYKVDGALTYNSSKNLIVRGDAEALINGSGSGATPLITLGGSLQRSGTALAKDLQRYDTKLYADVTPSPGDILLISTREYCAAHDPGTYAGRLADGAWFNNTRAYYWRGEMVEVLRVEPGSPNTIYLKGFLLDGYDCTKAKVYAMVAPRITVENLTIKRDSNTAGLLIRCGRQIELNGCYAEGARQSLYSLQYCRGGTVDNCSGTDFWYPVTGTSYGLAIGSCQDLVVRGSNLRGGRHAITHGGWEPNRNIVISHNTLDSYRDSGMACLDFHGNNENITVSENWIENGLVTQAKSILIKNNRIKAETTVGINLFAEVDTDYVDIIGNYIDTLQHGILVRNSDTCTSIAYKRIKIKDNELRSCVHGIRVTGSSALPTNLTIENLDVVDNDVETGAGWGIVTAAAIKDSTLTINECRILGGKYTSLAGGGAITIAAPGTINSLVVSGVRGVAKKNQRVFSISSVGNVTIDGCRCESAPGATVASLVLVASGKAKIIDNEFVNAARYGGCMVTAPTIVLGYNDYPPAAGSPVFAGTIVKHS